MSAFALRRAARLAAILLLSGAAADAAESERVTTPRVQASLIASRDVVRPGEVFQLALKQVIAPGWHTYWLNPGDSGEPVRIEWTLPDGARAGAIQWPAPTAFPFAGLVNHGFEDVSILPVEIAVPESARPGERFEIAAHATWLVCEKICVPEEARFALSLPVAQEAVADPAATRQIEAVRAALPQPAGFTAQLAPEGEKGLALSLPGLPAGARDLHFFPISDTLIDHAAAQMARSEGNGTRLDLARSGSFRLGSGPVEGVLTYVTEGRRRAIALSAAVDPALALATAAGGAAPVAVAPKLPRETADLTLWAAILLAFAGGLVLNAMPCVLPVLFIKALGFAQLARAEAARVREQGLLFLAGVLATFLVLGGAVIGLVAAGAQLGWGYQLQSPALVIGLAVVMVLIGLNLLGAFEIGARAGGIGQGVAGGGGRVGAFATGALAVVVATPCTAPFMGAAVGFALTQPPATGLTVFLALGLGFALPVLALSFAPGLLALLPRPGRWMLVLKQGFAFPMFATAIWLIWVASVQAGSAGLLAALSAVLAAGFCVWLIGLARDAHGPGRIAAMALALATALGAGLFVTQAAVPSAAGPRAGESEAWSPEKVAALQAQGRPVFVNFTAAWCITCLANEKVALSRQEVKEAFAGLGIAALKADWTNRDATIAAALAEFGRAGVPLYLVYPGRAGAEPEILPQLLTADTVVEAVRRAAAR